MLGCENIVGTSYSSHKLQASSSLVWNDKMSKVQLVANSQNLQLSKLAEGPIVYWSNPVVLKVTNVYTTEMDASISLDMHFWTFLWAA